MSQRELDGFTYLGFFARTFFTDRPCRVCGDPSEGYAIVIGHGSEYLLRLCGVCGKAADDHMANHSLGCQKISAECRRRILEEQGPSTRVGVRFGVCDSTVRLYRREARGSLLCKRVSEETRGAIRCATGTPTQIAKQFGVSPRTVYRIRAQQKQKVGCG